MGQDGFFRRAVLGGFNQDDVLDYIDDQQKQIDTLQAENARFFEEYKTLHDKYESNRAEVSSILEKLKSLTVAYKEKVAENEKLKQENARLLKRVRELESEKLSAASKIQPIKPSEPIQEAAAAASRSLPMPKSLSMSKFTSQKSIPDTKQASTSDISKEIGGLLLDAKRTADRLLDKAKAEVDEIKADGIRHMKHNIDIMESTSKQLLLLKSRMEDIFSRFSDHLEGMCQTLDDTKESVKQKEKEIPGKISKPGDANFHTAKDKFAKLQSEIQDVVANLDLNTLDNWEKKVDFNKLKDEFHG